MKICTKCNINKELHEYHKNPRTISKLSSWCKTCSNDKQRNSYKLNKDKICSNKKDYYGKNKETILKTIKTYKNNNKEQEKLRKQMWYKNNSDKKKVKYQLNKEKERLYKKTYNKQNSVKINARIKIYAKNNRGKINAKIAKYKHTKLNATPKWLTKDQLKQIEIAYIFSNLITSFIGIKCHVDHIVPLQGETYSGLHVPWNLQVTTAKFNTSKGNRLIHVSK